VPADASAGADDKLSAALQSLDEVAAFAGLAKVGQIEQTGLVRAVFIHDGDGWKFAWWSDGEKIYRTQWFEAHAPDPSRFLGRPLFPNDQSSP
jgi:hypothetical protein